MHCILPLLLLMTVATAAWGQRPAAPPADPLAGDTRLDRRVVVHVEGQAVDELLGLLKQRTGVDLAADADTRNDKVVVLGPARPLHDLMADLAALLNDRWEARREGAAPPRYVLVRDLKAKQYEARLARAPLERLMAQVDAQVHALAESPAQLKRRPADDPVRQMLSNAHSRLATAFYGLLGAAQKSQLWSDGYLDVPFADLTAAQQQAARRACVEVDQILSTAPGQSGGQSQPVRPEDLDGSWLVLSLGGSGDRLTRLTLDFEAAGEGICIASVEDEMRQALPPHGNPYNRQPVPPGAPLPPVAAMREAARGRTITDRLVALAGRAGQPVMADYYRVRPLNVTPRPPDARITVPDNGMAGLDALCEPDGYLWWVRGKTLLLRKRDWFLQRDYEPPDPWLVAAVERTRQTKRTPTYGDVLRADELTEYQIAGLDSLWEPEGAFISGRHVRGVKELLALWRATAIDHAQAVPGSPLSEEQMRRASVAYAEASPRQRECIRAFLRAFVGARAWGEPRRKPLAESEVAQFRAQIVRGTPFAVLGPDPSLAALLPVPVFLSWQMEGVQITQMPFTLQLPAELPDDRRDKTKVELAP